MIDVNVAIYESQIVNRNKWFEDVENRLSNKIINAAKTGIRFLEVPLNDLIIGGENLSEAAEMLIMLSTSLRQSGFSHKITPAGVLIISW